jgi:hypothetical protein
MAIDIYRNIADSTTETERTGIDNIASFLAIHNFSFLSVNG